jgi:alkylation response protein AidB-like acyl-CoA dehydrogenase
VGARWERWITNAGVSQFYTVFAVTDAYLDDSCGFWVG